MAFDTAGLDIWRMILLRPKPDAGGKNFRVQAMGAEFVARLGRSLEDQIIGADAKETLGSATKAYGRCLTTLARADDRARPRLQGSTVRFQRLRPANYHDRLMPAPPLEPVPGVQRSRG